MRYQTYLSNFNLLAEVAVLSDCFSAPNFKRRLRSMRRRATFICPKTTETPPLAN